MVAGNILLPTGSHSGNIRSGSFHGAMQHLSVSAPPPHTRLVIIDFEYASYNWRAFDFANHFCEWTLDYNVSTPPYFSYLPDKYPTEHEQRAFFQSYLEAGRCQAKSMQFKRSIVLCVAHLSRTAHVCRPTRTNGICNRCYDRRNASVRARIALLLGRLGVASGRAFASRVRLRG